MKTIMAEFTIDQKLQQLKQLTEEMETLTKELAEAGAFEIPEGELDHVSGGASVTNKDHDMELVLGAVQQIREILEKAKQEGRK